MAIVTPLLGKFWNPRKCSRRNQLCYDTGRKKKLPLFQQRNKRRRQSLSLKGGMMLILDDEILCHIAMRNKCGIMSQFQIEELHIT